MSSFNIFILALFYGSFDLTHDVLAKDPELCLKGSCIHSAHNLLLNMDLSVDPCQDFNKFSCGGFPKNNFILEKDGEVNEFVKARKHLRNKIIRLFNENKLSNGNVAFDTDEKIRNFYHGCKIFQKKKNKDQIFGTPFQSMLRKIGIADWPYSRESWQNGTEWYDVVANMMREGLVVGDGFIELPIVNVEVGINDFNESFHSLKIDQPKFHSPFDRATLTSFDDGHLSQHLGQVIEKIKLFVSTALKRNDTNVVFDAIYKSVEIEKILATIADDSDNRKSVRVHGVRQDERNYTNISINELPDLPCSAPCSDTISWPEYIKRLFEAVDLPDVDVNKTDTIIVKNMEYITNVKTKLDEANLYPMDWANYLGFKLLQTFQTAQQNFDSEFEDNCENYLIAGKQLTRFGLLHGAVGSMYVRKYFNQEKKEDVENMVDYMKKGFKKCICENPSFKWMDSETQTAALEKIEAMEGDIAYPQELLNKNIVDSYYDGMF